MWINHEEKNKNFSRGRAATYTYAESCLFAPCSGFYSFFTKKMFFAVFFFLNQNSGWVTYTYLMPEDRKTCFKHAVLTLPLAAHILFPLYNSNIL